MREQLRRLAFGLATVSGLRARGFFIPYRYAASVIPTEYPALRVMMRAAEPAFAAVIDAIEGQRADLLAILAGDGPARFDQEWYPRLDAAAAYTMVRRAHPRRIVEVGSGHSTRFLARAAADGGIATDILCIDPSPRARIADLKVRHVKDVLTGVAPSVFESLRAGDILFIDSSHIAMPGTDVDRLFLDILPRLASGVLIHVHDIFLPDAYPEDWTWRAYNEQLLVGALLQGGAYELLFASRYVATRMPDHVKGSVLTQIPLRPGARETSLWLRKR